MDYYIISLMHAAICLASSLLIVHDIRIKGPRLITLATGSFILISSFGLAYSHYVNYGAALSFADDQGMVVYKRDVGLYLSQVTSHWIFLGILSLGIVLTSGKHPTPARQFHLGSPALWRGILLFYCVFAYSRYFLFGPGLETLLETRLLYFSAEDAVMARSLANTNLYGQGAYLASVAAYIVFPILCASSVAKQLYVAPRVTRKHYITILLFALLSFAYAYQTRQKAPLLQVMLIYAFIHFVIHYELQRRLRPMASSKRGIFRLIVLGLAFFGFAVALYVLIFNLSFTSAIYSTVVRLFMVPTATEANYFYVFPERFPYRGILESLVIRVFTPPGGSGISIYDVAQAATGIGFSANASLLAIGWSGAGYLGVFFVSGILCSLLIICDRLIRFSPRIDRLFYLAISLPPLLVLNSGALLDYLGAGGVINVLILALVLPKLRNSSAGQTANISSPLMPAMTRGFH
ncbi:hypothetical protein [Pigmentiphaga sp. D-2]|uniref:hypothetical protein n=1 Tax=Pigmentiphaga sp. D-2 TaxID=1002116 RepID=UPI00105119D6|nr:hypothetical protein [Pigmentiphaga sp. D-2]